MRSVFKIVFLLLLFYGNLPVCGQTNNELKYVLTDTIMTNVESDEPDLKNYMNDQSWYYIDKKNPVSVVEVGLNNKDRKHYSFNQSPTRANNIKNIYGDDTYVCVVFSQKILILKKASGVVSEIKYDKGEDYTYCSIHGDTLTLYGVYNYHIKDGFPMLQIANYILPDSKKINSKKIFFPGIFYTALVGQFIEVRDGHIYYITPTSNYYYMMNLELNSVDSFLIDENELYSNTHPILERLDSVNYYNVHQKINNKNRFLNYEWGKGDLMNIKDIDTCIYRNEKIHVNSRYIFVTRKPRGFSGWNKREIFIIDKINGGIIKRESNLDRQKDYYKPNFVSSSMSHLNNFKYYSLLNSVHFFDPNVASKEEYDDRLKKWAVETDVYYYILNIYELIFDK